ncbi:MAG TPA: chain length-determining protein, partial [Pseudothauera hydrothermalis]|nr:chain length-determining protein [Pseudothauera hydrothermalis]
RALLMLLASLAAVGVGVALTFLISQLRPSFADGRTLREVTGLPVLGVVSRLRDPKRETQERRGRYMFAGGVAGYAGAVAAVTVALTMLQG